MYTRIVLLLRQATSSRKQCTRVSSFCSCKPPLADADRTATYNIFPSHPMAVRHAHQGHGVVNFVTGTGQPSRDVICTIVQVIPRIVLPAPWELTQRDVFRHSVGGIFKDRDQAYAAQVCAPFPGRQHARPHGLVERAMTSSDRERTSAYFKAIRARSVEIESTENRLGSRHGGNGEGSTTSPHHGVVKYIISMQVWIECHFFFSGCFCWV